MSETLSNELYKMLIVYEEQNGIDIADAKHKLLQEFTNYLRQNSAALAATCKTPGTTPAIDRIDYAQFFDAEARAVATLDENTEWIKSRNFKKDGKQLWYRVPQNSDDVSGKRYHRFTQLSLEIMVGQSADTWLTKMEGAAADITNRVRNATAGTNPVTNAELLNWADDIYNIRHSIAAFFDTDAAKNIPALKIKLLEAAALCINLYDRESGIIAEDATDYDPVFIQAKIKDWLDMGLGIRFFFGQWMRFSPNFRNSLQAYIQKFSA